MSLSQIRRRKELLLKEEEEEACHVAVQWRSDSGWISGSV
jgi:hypothetical protein